MNKPELISAIAEKSGFTKKDVTTCVDAILSTITNALAKGEEVSITGFGKFSVAERAAREGRNPQTGETLKIAACKAPKFKAGKALKDAVNA